MAAFSFYIVRVARAAPVRASCPCALPFLPQQADRQMSTSHRQKARRQLAWYTQTMSSQAQLSKYRYRRRLPHFQKADAALCVTSCTGARLNLPPEGRDLVLEHILREHGKRIRLYAAVVMPDHVHLEIARKSVES